MAYKHKGTIQQVLTDYACLGKRFTITEDYSLAWGRFSFDLGGLNVEGFDTQAEALDNVVRTIKETKG